MENKWIDSEEYEFYNKWKAEREKDAGIKEEIESLVKKILLRSDVNSSVNIKIEVSRDIFDRFISENSLGKLDIKEVQFYILSPNNKVTLKIKDVFI